MSLQLKADNMSPEDVLNQTVALKPGAGLFLDFTDTDARHRYVARLYAVRARAARNGEKPWDAVQFVKVGAVTLRLDTGRKPQRRNEVPLRVTVGTL